MSDPRDPTPMPAKLFAGVFMGIFGVIGILVLSFLWSEPEGPHAPPVFFKLFGSLIAIAFIAFSGMAITGLVTGKGRIGRSRRRRGLRKDFQLPHGDESTRDFGCPNCGAGLASDVEISPSGDVKCPHCRNWFNVR